MSETVHRAAAPLEIDPRAVIAPGARLGAGIRIGAYAVVGDEVELGEECVLHPHAVVNGPARLGRSNVLHPFCRIGGDPQDLKYAGERTRLEAGDRNVFRECVTVSRGTIQGGGLTRIGSDNLFMASAHVAHDCVVGNHTIFANSATLAGHVTVEDYSTIGAFSPVHQFCRIGRHAYVGASTVVTRGKGGTSCVTTVEAPTYAWRPMRQNWCTGEKAPTVAKSSTSTCPASVAPLTKSALFPTRESCPTCE